MQLSDLTDIGTISYREGLVLRSAGFCIESSTLYGSEIFNDLDWIADIVEDTSPQLGGDLDGRSLYDLVNMVAGTFSGTLTTGSLYIDDIHIESDDISFPSGSAILGAGDIYIKPSGDTDDYLVFKTTSHVPEIGTVGSCNLKISSSAEIDIVASDSIDMSAGASGDIDINGRTQLTLRADEAGGFVDISPTGQIDLKPSNDADDYIELTTTSHQTTIRFVGQNGLITADDGTISFDDEHISTTGNLTDGTNSLTIANAKTAYDHSQDNTQAHSDYLINNGNDTTTGGLTITPGTSVVGLTVNQGDDAKGIEIYGYDDQSAEYLKLYVSSGGSSTILGSTNLGYTAGTGYFFVTVGTDIYFTLGDAAGAKEVKIRDSGTAVVSEIDSDGNAHFLGSYAQVIGGTNTDLYIDNAGLIGPNPSSIRHKENIRDLTGSELIHQLRPVRYDRKDGSGENLTGFVAEEVAGAMPELISYKREIIWEDVINDDGMPERIIKEIHQTDIPLTVNHSKLIPHLVAEIQNLRAEVEILKAA